MTLATEVPSPVFTPVLAREATARRIPALRTERLVLRALCQRDVPVIVQLAGDRRVAENTARIPHPYSTDAAEQFVAQANRQNDSATFAITLDGAPIGACGIDVRQDGAELGYWLGVPFWGCGYATEAVRAVIDYAFSELSHELLQSGARVSNPASRRVLEKCGFQWTGVRLCRIRAINSAAPIDRFRLDRRLWASLKAWVQARQVA
ncbi:MAG TPA: GNAT family N-acetyltransferase [Xanthobacteraceae bacterium]|nr:GNAT family N-acetyltransferase [Xanthobacteraceae bacterium]